MQIDLSGDIRKSLLDALARARKHYDAGEDEKAAAAYEAASRLALRLAEYAPDRSSEVRHKKEAMQYREAARRLSSGEAPAVAERNAPVSSPVPVTEKPAGKHAAPPPSPGNELGSAVSQLITTSPITWDEIGGLEETKREIKYALALSIARPPPGVSIASWRNVLFYGPPGTGKTLLAAATSNALRLNARTESRAVFFNVKVSSVMSKYFGESTKIVSELYGQARDASPAVVFLDEFESLAGERGEGDSGPERRILSTILSELDGLAEKGRKDIYVLTIAATNRPWELDPAVLSRFEKKILIPLPDEATRRAILEIHLAKKGFASAVPLDELAAATDGYSGRELERFCKEVTTRMIAEENRGLPAIVDQGLDAVRSYEVRVRSLTRAEFDAARRRITPQTTAAEMARYTEWRESVTS
jgi:SpoVK/Ycf46/Vps4 family AAA+-type ATPase